MKRTPDSGSGYIYINSDAFAEGVCGQNRLLLPAAGERTEGFPARSVLTFSRMLRKRSGKPYCCNFRKDSGVNFGREYNNFG